MTLGAPRDANGRFHNTAPFAVRSLADVLRWQWRARRDGLPLAPEQPIPTCAPDLDFIARNAGGAYEPRWFMAPQHVNAEEAVRVHEDLGAKHSLGVHWDTFELTDEPLDEPPRTLVQAVQAHGLRAHDFGVIAIGETLPLPRRQPLTPTP
jgi:L-ascorbate metabolism protein UlaG (beta-lactamase superfamily)